MAPFPTNPELEGRSFAQSLDLLLTRRFGTFFIASLLSNLGTWAQQVAEPWLLISIGASPFILGLDSFAMSAPVFALTLLGGILADRGDRRRIIARFQVFQMLCPIALVALILLDAVQAWMVVSASLIVGITDALSMPSFQSIAPSIVRKEQIPSALALNSIQFNLSRILGPAVAGLIMTFLGPIGCFALNAASYLPFIGISLWILPRRGRKVGNTHAFDRRHLFDGIRAFMIEPVTRGALATLVVTSALCGPVVTFCPILIKEAFHADVGEFSLSLAAFGLGGLAGAAGLLTVEPSRDRRPIASFSAVTHGAVLLLIGLDPWLWALPLLLFAAGLTMTAGNISSYALLQSFSGERLRGQAASLEMLAIRGGLSFGSLVTGLSIEWVGVQNALLINGALAVAFQLLLLKAWLPLKLPSSDPDSSVSNVVGSSNQ